MRASIGTAVKRAVLNDLFSESVSMIDKETFVLQAVITRVRSLVLQVLNGHD